MKTYRNLSILAIAVMIGMAGCKSNTTSPNGGGNTTLTIPGVGSVAIFDNYQTDTLTGAKIPGTEVFDTITVIATHLAFAGKTNVSQLRVNATSSIDVSFLSYESNGDVSYYIRSNGQPGERSGWLTVPLASKGQQSFTVFDTTYSNGSDRTVETLTYSGASSMALAGQTFAANSFQDQVMDNSMMTHNSVDWFDVATGMVLQIDEPVISAYGFKQNGSHMVLISYSVK